VFEAAMCACKRSGRRDEQGQATRLLLDLEDALLLRNDNFLRSFKVLIITPIRFLF
jgi:hypothetical protein